MKPEKNRHITATVSATMLPTPNAGTVAAMSSSMLKLDISGSVAGKGSMSKIRIVWLTIVCAETHCKLS